MPQPYDVNEIFAEMELELMRSYKRNMARHAQAEIDEGFQWEMWQQAKLRDLAAYKREARIIIDKHTRRAKDAATGVIHSNYTNGENEAEALLSGRVSTRVGDASFFTGNRSKMDALIDATNNDFDVAAHATLRKVEDEYRKIIFKSQLMFNSGATTLTKAVDIAAKDFLQNGITAIRYANGANVNIASYAEMCLRTSAKKAYMTGEGAKQAEWGEYLTQITSYGACSPTCLPFQGKVFVNDVYAGGKPDGKHPLLSAAMAEGLFHPNCRHKALPWFEDISYAPPEVDREKTLQNYEVQQRQRQVERNIRKYKRVAEGSIDPDNKAKAEQKVAQWQAVMRKHIRENPQLRRNYAREKLIV